MELGDDGDAAEGFSCKSGPVTPTKAQREARTSPRKSRASSCPLNLLLPERVMPSVSVAGGRPSDEGPGLRPLADHKPDES